MYGETVLIERRGKTPGKNGRRASDRVGEAVCDMKGDLWEIDAAFLIYMKEMVPGWCGGNLPSEVMEGLKNTGRHQAAGIFLSAEPKEGGKIQLKVKKAG